MIIISDHIKERLPGYILIFMCHYNLFTHSLKTHLIIINNIKIDGKDNAAWSSSVSRTDHLDYYNNSPLLSLKTQA